MKPIALLVIASHAATACGNGGGALASGADAIVGGRRDTTHRAVGRIGHAGDHGVDWLCTGTAIAPRVVLTAAHCLHGASGRRVARTRVRFDAEGEVYAAVRTEVAPGYAPGGPGPWDDLAVVVLERDAGEAPIPIARSRPEAGARAAVLGFGITGNGGGAGVRRKALITLDAVAARELAYVADGRGACFGDSGGPILQDLGAGEVVAGVTSRGTGDDCTGVDVATRVDPFAEWIAAQLP